MTGEGGWLLILILLSSFFTGVAIFHLGEYQGRLRTVLNLLGAGLKVLLVGVMLTGVYFGVIFEFRLPLASGLDFALRADALGLQFVTLSAGLWLVTTIYAIGYLEGSPERSRFFGFFSLCVTASTGVALSGNLFTFIIFYEFLTLATYPLVVHRGTEKVLRAGRTYLIYTLGGGVLLLLGAVWLHALGAGLDFGEPGNLDALVERAPLAAVLLFWLLIAGLGVKAALVPLHGWLPIAMVAPAPVSALLHAVAVVKAGAFGIVRLLYDVYGIETTVALGVNVWLAVLASFTIVYGSLSALRQNEIKSRLAYSTVSQLSYITLGVAIAGPIATVGGLVHLVHQGLMKITLFFCAGNLAETLHIHNVSEMNGIGRVMPVTMAAFTLAGLGMIGLPPLAGFVSKWYIATGGLEAGYSWVMPVLIASSVLNAAYFLPPIYRAWFKAPPESLAREHPGFECGASLWLLLPAVATAAFALMAGLLAQAPFSPLSWARLIVEREYFAGVLF